MEPILRIIDANANRAREGLRVLEDIARFVLNRADLCERAKVARHALVEALGRLPQPAARILASRDTSGDVGTRIGTPGEYKRTGLISVARAAAGRTAEALRCIEEMSKSLGQAGLAQSIESARYRTYELEQDLILALPSPRASAWKLCVLVTESLCRHHPWERVVQLSIQGGADCIQLREKSLEDGELLRRARTLIDLCKAESSNTAAVINDRVDIAIISGADGVHLGQNDLPTRDARALAGHGLCIGRSTSTIEQARAAIAEGADYVGLGPMFPTTTKHKDMIAGPELVRHVVADEQLRDIPHLAIGGVDASNARLLASVGCRGVAVSSAVCGSEDPTGVCRHIVQAITASSR